MKYNNAKILKKFQAEHKIVVSRFIVKMGVEAKNHFIRNFSRQGFLDETIDPWQKRKSKKSSGHGILIKSGDLRRSIKVLKRNRKGITVGSDLPYAQVHNEGGVINRKQRSNSINFKINKNGTSRFAKKKNANFQMDVTIGAHSFKMPKRQFIGNSSFLTKKLTNILRADINRAFRNK